MSSLLIKEIDVVINDEIQFIVKIKQDGSRVVSEEVLMEAYQLRGETKLPIIEFTNEFYYVIGLYGYWKLNNNLEGCSFAGISTLVKAFQAPFIQDYSFYKAIEKLLGEKCIIIFNTSDHRHELATDDNKGFVYLAYSDTRHYKIGRSKKPNSRIRHFDTIMPVEVKPLHFIQCSDCIFIERYFHDIFIDSRLKGEWFSLSSKDAEFFMSFDFAIGHRLLNGGVYKELLQTLTFGGYQ